MYFKETMQIKPNSWSLWETWLEKERKIASVEVHWFTWIILTRVNSNLQSDISLSDSLLQGHIASLGKFKVSNLNISTLSQSYKSFLFYTARVYRIHTDIHRVNIIHHYLLCYSDNPYVLFVNPPMPSPRHWKLIYLPQKVVFCSVVLIIINFTSQCTSLVLLNPSYINYITFPHIFSPVSFSFFFHLN